jgi:subtilase family serine protease
MPNLRIGTVPPVVQQVSGGTRTITFRVRKLGFGITKKTTVYVDAVDPSPPPGQNEIRIQVSVDLAPFFNLFPASRTLSATFPEAELTAKAVSRFDLTVDAKNLVNESNENDNRVSVPRS